VARARANPVAATNGRIKNATESGSPIGALMGRWVYGYTSSHNTAHHAGIVGYFDVIEKVFCVLALWKSWACAECRCSVDVSHVYAKGFLASGTDNNTAVSGKLPNLTSVSWPEDAWGLEV
jgi:hypothetical protein